MTLFEKLSPVYWKRIDVILAFGVEKYSCMYLKIRSTSILEIDLNHSLVQDYKFCIF